MNINNLRAFEEMDLQDQKKKKSAGEWKTDWVLRRGKAEQRHLEWDST